MISEKAKVQPSIKLKVGLPNKPLENKTKQKRSRIYLCLTGGDSPLGASAQFVTGLILLADCRRRRLLPRWRAVVLN